MTARSPLAEILLAHQLVDEYALDLAIDHAEAHERSLLAVLVERDAIDDALAARVLSSELNLYRVDLDQRVIDKSALAEIEPRAAHHYRVVPVGLKRTAESDHLYVAVSDPTGPALAELQATTEKQLVPLVATEGALQRVLLRCYPGRYEPIRSSPDPVDMPAFADVVVGNIIDDPAPVDRGGSEWLTASTQEVLEIYAPTLNVPPPRSPSSQARDDDWLRDRLAAAQGEQEAMHRLPAPIVTPAKPRAIASLGSQEPLPATSPPEAKANFGTPPSTPAPLDAAVIQALPSAVKSATQVRAARASLEIPPDSGETALHDASSHSPPTLDDVVLPGNQHIGRSARLPQLDPSELEEVKPPASNLPSADLQTLEPLNLETLPLDEAGEPTFDDVNTDSIPGNGDQNGVTIVCEDQRIRLQLRTSLSEVLEDLYDHAHLADAHAIIENGTVKRVVLLYPRADGTLVSALRTFRSLEQPPSVLVISRNRAFEVMRGVDVRVDPPDELSLLPEALFDALSRLGTR